MKALIETALSKSRSTLFAFFMIIVAGAVSYTDIPREADPDIPIPIIYILLKHDGISPEDSERLLLQTMESKLRSIEGVKEMRTSAYEGGASIVLEFDAGFDSNEALSNVRERVDLGKAALPDETEEPIVKEVNLSLFPVLVVTLSGNVPERTLLKFARKVRDDIEDINSVLEAKLTGNRKELVEVIIDPAQLEGYKIDSIQVLQTIARSNLLVAAGVLDTGNGRFPIKVPGLYENLPNILRQPIKAVDDSVVTIADVASVRRTFKDADSLARLSGEPAIGIEVSKRNGENIIETIKSIRELVDRKSKEWPDGIKYTFSQDRSVHIHEMLRDLQNNVISAVLLVMIIIIGTLGWRAGVMVGIAIPGSFLLGILVLAALGLSINIVVLFSLILSVGMLVDGAIVVTEFADRRMSEGAPRKEAYGRSAKRMAWPIIASTATTLAAFLPLLFWPGIVGEFMKFLPITLLSVLTASLLMALIFVPSLGALIGSPSGQPLTTKSNAEVGETLNPDEKGFTQIYVRLLRQALNNPAKVIFAAVTALISVQYLYVVAGNGIEFFPDVEPDSAKVYIHARGNLSTQEKAKIVYEIEQEVLLLDELKSVYTYVGKSRGGQKDIPGDVIGTIQLEFKNWRQRRPTGKILVEIVERAEKFPGIIVEFVEQKKGPPTGKPLKLQITSENLEDLTKTTSLVRNHMENINGLINIEDDRDIPAIEWELLVDRAQAAKFDVDIALIGNHVRLITNGMKLTEFTPNDSDEELDIVVKYPRRYRKLSQFERIRIKTNKGLVPISNFIRWAPREKIGVIKRVQSERAKTIKADVRPGVLVDSKVRELKTWLKTEAIPASVNITFKGEDEEQKKAKSFLVKAFSAALFIIAIILVTQFNSFYSAFLILSAVVMSTVGVLIGLMITGKPFGIVMTGVGVIALAGIVVNNNIVLIDTFDHIRRTSNDTLDAILKAGKERLRPVLLTTTTTILGLLPMVLQTNIDFLTREITIGAPSMQWWSSLSTAIVFGLGFATILTLVVTPCALMLRVNIKKSLTYKKLLRTPHPQ
ncbi:MAG: MFS transporter [Rhodospirillaceae bacterium]|nr:MFS transporter [Rhodospirillaceae bacterium]